MRDFLHVCIGGTILRAALAGAVLVLATPVLAQGKVIRSEVAAGISNPDLAESAKPAPTAPVAAAPVPATLAKPEAKGRTAVDTNAPEPLSERAQAALDRAKSALEAEDADGFVAEPTPLAAPIAEGQPVKARDKSATATTKPAVKCLAGC